jgi:hypothetical protein
MRKKAVKKKAEDPKMLRECLDKWKDMYAAGAKDGFFISLACELNMTAYEDAIAHSKLNHALLTEAIDNLNLWKRIWQTDTRYYYEQARKQADLIAALVEGNKALRAALDKHELFHVKSKELRA